MTLASLTEYLRQVDALQQETHHKDNWRYSSYEGFVLDQGSDHPWRPRPHWVKKGEDKRCFENAYILARKYDLMYVEGYATSIIPVLHAWCLDDEGYVIDPTWDEEMRTNHIYFGIAFDLKYVSATIARHGYWGILANDWRDECQILITGECT